MDTEFDADAALNRVLSAITPFRAEVHSAESSEQVNSLTTVALAQATQAIGVPLTQDVAMGLLFAAVLRLADMWNGQGETVEIPDSLPDA
jgi:hypothetical protein